jgi:8-oxo-dGTP diphosphatase
VHDRVVVAVIQSANGEVLIAERPIGKSFAGYWEFPGGKIEANETPFAALKRELHEEIAIEVITALPLGETEYTHSERAIHLSIWHVKDYRGTPIGNEGQAIRWVLPKLLSQYQFPPANDVILNKIFELATS